MVTRRPSGWSPGGPRYLACGARVLLWLDWRWLGVVPARWSAPESDEGGGPLIQPVVAPSQRRRQACDDSPMRVAKSLLISAAILAIVPTSGCSRRGRLRRHPTVVPPEPVAAIAAPQFPIAHADLVVDLPPPRDDAPIPTDCCRGERACEGILRDPHAPKAQWACAANQLVGMGPSVTKRMLALLEAPDLGARARTAFVLARGRAPGSEVSDALLRELERGAQLAPDDAGSDEGRRTFAREVRVTFNWHRTYGSGGISTTGWKLCEVLRDGSHPGAAEQALDVLSYLASVRLPATPDPLAAHPDAPDAYSRLTAEVLYGVDCATVVGLRGVPVRDRRFLRAALPWLDDYGLEVRSEARAVVSDLATLTELPLLVRLLHEPGGGRALFRLGALGPGAASAAPDVRELLLTGDWDHRATAAQVLGSLGDGASAPALVSALSAPDFRVATEAATALGSLPVDDPTIAPHLIDVARHHWDGSTREAAARALRARGVPARRIGFVPLREQPSTTDEIAFEVTSGGHVLRLEHRARSAEVDGGAHEDDTRARGGEMVTARADLGDRVALGTVQRDPETGSLPRRNLVVVDKKSGARTVVWSDAYVEAVVEAPRGLFVVGTQRWDFGPRFCQVALLSRADLSLQPIAELPGGVLESTADDTGALIAVLGIGSGTGIAAFRVTGDGVVERVAVRGIGH